jgi:CBS-domain-containing membrane protein
MRNESFAVPVRIRPQAQESRDRDGPAALSELMRATTLSTSIHTPAKALLALFGSTGADSIALLDDAKRLVGVVTASSMLSTLLESQAINSNADHIDTGDLLRPVTHLAPDASVAEAAAAIALDRVHDLPVVGPRGAIAGSVSSFDITRWYARCRGYLIP